MRAFNLNGAGPFSRVQFGQTLGGRRERKEERETAAVKQENKVETAKQKDKLQDEEARLYLIIGE